MTRPSAADPCTASRVASHPGAGKSTGVSLTSADRAGVSWCSSSIVARRSGRTYGATPGTSVASYEVPAECNEGCGKQDQSQQTETGESDERVGVAGRDQR